jgi:hypothetical protein
MHLSCPQYMLHAPTHHIFLDFTNRIMFGEEYKLKSSLLCSLVQYYLASSLLGPNVFLIALFLSTLSLFLPQC